MLARLLLLTVLCVALPAGVLRAAEPVSQPLGPADALAKFELPAGLAIELVAAEPLVVDPVAISFDERGRMFAVEYRDYPLGPGAGKPPLSRVRLLEDTDNDGRMDQSHLFAEGLNFAQGVLAYEGGVIITAAPDILFLKDADGDGRAEVRQVLLTGFKEGNPQLRVAHPRLGLDGWIYVTNGLSGGQVQTPDGKKLEMGKADLRFRLSKKDGALSISDVELVAGTGQFGNTFDDWGHRFFCTNRNPVMYAPIPYAAASRNPYAVISQLQEDVAPFGGEAKVYPLVEGKTTAMSHAGTHTAACGVHVYRGDALGTAFAGNVFVCEPTGSLVTRSMLTPKGVSFTAARAEAGSDFLASTDPWFRPVSLADGPDGCLYVVDMYREVIEHPQYMPAGLADKLNLRAGDDRGRVYRIRPKEFKRRSFAEPKIDRAMLALLEDANGWRRDLGQRLLASKYASPAAQFPSNVRVGPEFLNQAELKRLAAEATDPRTRLHALYLLSRVAAPEDGFLVERALQDTDPRVQEHAWQLSGYSQGSQAARAKAADLARALVEMPPRTALTLVLAAADDPTSASFLASVAAFRVNDPWFRRAVATATKERSAAVLLGALDWRGVVIPSERFTKVGTAEKIELISTLAAIAGARGDVAELNSLLQRVGGGDSGEWWQTAILTGLAQGLARHQGALGKTSLAKLLAAPPPELAESAKRAAELLAQTAKLASDAKRPPSDRVAAARLLAWLPPAEAEPALDALLAASVPPEVQSAAIDALRTGHYDRAPPILFKHWNTLSPATRSAAVDLLLGKPTTTLPFLQAMAEGKIPASVVGLERRDALLRSPNADLKKLAEQLFGGQVSANRKEVADKYAAALTLAADASRGHAVFKRICAACHKVRGEGHEIGPDITDVRNKTRETLLFDILDPNRAVEPRWVSYVATTTDGRAATGLLASETGTTIVLRRAEGKEDVLVRSEIEEIQATGKSLMPEGVEKDITVEQMADLIEFLKARTAPAAATGK